MSLFTQGMFQIPANLTPEELRDRRERLEKIMPKFGSARYVGEGIGHAITGAVAGFKGRKLDAAERESRSSAEQMMRDLFGLPGDGGANYSGGASSGGGAGGGFSILGSAPEGGEFTGGVPTIPASLYRTESGGDFGVSNDVNAGHFGRLQFNPDWINRAGEAGVIRAGMTPQEFLADPNAQVALEEWYSGEIWGGIEDNGLDKYVGQTINGVPVTPAGLFAVAHLGGMGGLEKFLSSGGQYNPSDAYGTSLTDYLATHAGPRPGVSPAPGASAPGMTTGTGLAEAVMPPMDGGAAPVASAKGQPLGMIGGVRGDGGYWQSFDGDGLAHAANPGYTDYSQLFRDYTFEQKPGYVPVGERDGQTVYAAPDYLRGEDGNYMPVSAADVQRLAAERGGLVPTRDEVAALYDVATQIPMPTQPIGETGGPGNPAAYTAAVTQALGGQAPTGPIAHGKEFFAPGMGGQPPAAPQAAPMEPPTSPLVPRPTPAQYTPRGGGNRPTNQQLLGALMNPWITPDQKAVIQYMLAENQRAAELSAPKQPDMKWIAGVGLVDMNNPPPELMAGNFQAPEGEGVGVQSASPLPDMSGVLMPMKDGSILVRTAGGEELTGQAAMDFIKRANDAYAEQQREIYGARREGTLGADIEMGGEAAAAVKAGENAQAAGMAAWEAIPQARASIPKLQRVIELIDAGADVGMISSQLPALNDATRELRNLQSQLGLDVIGSVTFGALNKSELDLALSTALPDNMGKDALKDWVRRKMVAQEKLASYMEEQARFLLQPGNTLTGWMDYISTNKQPAAPAALPPSAPPTAPGGAVSAPPVAMPPGGNIPPPPPGIDPSIWPQVWEKLSPEDQRLLSQ